MNRNSQAFVILLLFVSFIFVSLSAAADSGGERVMEFGGRKRVYSVRAPEKLLYTKRVPLLVVLHGGGPGQDDEKIENITGFTEIAAREDFVVVYPNAIEHNWNDGRAVPDYVSQKENVDDVGFLRAVISEVEKSYPIDSERIYMTGPSNGGMMTFRMACEASDKIAAIATVIANMPVNTFNLCRPSRAVPLMQTVGTDDPLMPFNGGDVMALRRPAGKVVSTKETIDFWKRRNGCGAEARIASLPDVHPDDGSSVRKEQFVGCRADTMLYTVIGGGHTWSRIEGSKGGFIRKRLVKRALGLTNTDFDLSENIWDFLSRQRLHG